MQKLQETFDYLKQFLTEDRQSKIEKIAHESSDFILPIMEDVYQFRNAAAIVRSVEACGFHRIVALESRNVFDPNLSVTKGAENWVKVEKRPHNSETLQEIRKLGYKLVAVSPETEATPLSDFQITEPVALIFGTEWEGVSADFLNFCEDTISIPMYGFTQSFNVSVAAAICMYELKQKLVRSKIEYRLSEKKRLELQIMWAVNSIKSGAQILEEYERANRK